MKKVVIGLFALCMSALSVADDVQLRDGHPDSHTVVKGDTLWDISETFLQNPWLWPEIWHVNPQIDNPHLIYPGDIVKLIYLDGEPRLTLERGQRAYKLQPSARIQPLQDAIPAIPLDKINQFLSRSRVVNPGEMEAAPYVLTGAEEHLVVGAGDKLYARGDFEEGGRVYGVYRAGQRFVDPETNELLGLQALDIGSVKRVALENDVATFDVTRTTEEIRIADRLLPTEERAVDSTFFPSAPADDLTGMIMAVEGGLTQVGPMDVVAINRGDREGVKIGNVFAIYKAGGAVRDRVTNEMVRLPDEQAGLLMVFRTFDKMSFGLVLEASRPLKVKDLLRAP